MSNHQINLLNIHQVNSSYEELKIEINKLCKRGEYDFETFQKVSNNLTILQKAIESLDQCQNILLSLAKKNEVIDEPFDPENLNMSRSHAKNIEELN